MPPAVEAPMNSNPADTLREEGPGGFANVRTRGGGRDRRVAAVPPPQV
jgi:hypothetical protein